MSNQHDKRIALITGANRGIGFYAAREIAARGWHVVMMCRNPAAASRACDELQHAVPGAAVDVVEADLSEQASVRAAAANVLNRFNRLDALVHNAAVVAARRTITEDNIELQFAVNHLAPFLLTHLLRDRLVETGHARVVTVSSRAHLLGQIHFDDLSFSTGYSHRTAYRQSKLANILFTRELARRLHGTSVTANCVHPGVILTNLLGELSRLPPVVRWVLRPFTISEPEGAAGTVRLVTDPSLKDVTGQYFDRTRRADPGRHAMDDDTARRLWTVSQELTGIT